MSTTLASVETALRLRPEVLTEVREGDLVITHPRGVTRVRAPGAGLLAAVDALRGPGAGEAELERLVLDGPDAGGPDLDRLARWLLLLGKLSAAVVHEVRSDGRPALTVTPISPWSSFGARPVPGPGAALSRFAYLRLLDGTPVLESPLSHERISLHDPGVVALVASLTGAAGGAGGAVSAGAAEPGGPDPRTRDAVLAHLNGAGMLATPAERTDRDLLTWEFHDLLFHRRSRRGRHDYPAGAVFPYLGEFEPLPAVKEPPAGSRHALARPAPGGPDLTLTEALERRRSVRGYGERPMTAEQLGEFLHRVARVRAVRPPSADAPYETSDRPVPSGGAGHDLELYLTLHRIDGLPRGVYHYDPLGHRLTLITDEEAAIHRQVQDASMSAAWICVPDVLVSLTSRFQRLSWKYRSISYATTLKHVGVLYQTMYLVATAMGLAPCALGGTNTDHTDRLLGLDPLRESTVGEFMLGSRAG